MRRWDIYIPVRPKAVQSVRGSRTGFYQDPKIRRWKASIRPYIERACDGPPSSLPMRIVRLVYMFRYPQATSKKIRDYIESGGVVPYIGCADITDNLAKGLVDTCAGLVFENDKMIWRTCDVEKVYAAEDGIRIVFEETPDVILVDGRAGTGERLSDDTLFGL